VYAETTSFHLDDGSECVPLQRRAPIVRDVETGAVMDFVL